MALLEIYKRGQGRYARIITLVSVMVLGLAGAVALSERLRLYGPPIVQFGVPVVALLALAALMFWMINRPKSADFLIATEGEMKKVSWSSRKEIVGSTKVVVVAVLMMAGVLGAVDALFAVLSRLIGLTGG